MPGAPGSWGSVSSGALVLVSPLAQEASAECTRGAAHRLEKRCKLAAQREGPLTGQNSPPDGWSGGEGGGNLSRERTLSVRVMASSPQEA